MGKQSGGVADGAAGDGGSSSSKRQGFRQPLSHTPLVNIICFWGGVLINFIRLFFSALS